MMSTNINHFDEEWTFLKNELSFVAVRTTKHLVFGNDKCCFQNITYPSSFHTFAGKEELFI